MSTLHRVRWWRVAAAVLITVATLLSTVTAGIGMVRLHAPAPSDRTSDQVVSDALPRLEFIRAALDDGAGERMQQLFPEGYFFIHVLYGLTWVDVGRRDETLRPIAIEQAWWALARLDTPAGRAPFSPRLSPPYGVFYAGWSTWLRGGVLNLAGGPPADPGQAHRFFADADALTQAFTTSLDAGTPFLPAYPGRAWPVDSVVGMAAVALAADLAGTQAAEPGSAVAAAYPQLRNRWFAAADARRDPATGLLPHRVDPATGTAAEGARATSQALLLRFLYELDPETATADWVRFREQFGSPVPGVPGFREHPRGVRAGGDVDSGPLLLGLSASASVVGLGTAVLVGDRASARALTGVVEAVGGAVQLNGQRRYVGGLFPVGDAFLAWSLAADGWLVEVRSDGSVAGGFSVWWRLPWYVVTGWGLAIAWVATGVCWWLRRLDAPKT